ncbi:MAG: carboxypeptidase regulatory-like domain-containing protein [Acidobacteriota bacterium]
MKRLLVVAALLLSTLAMHGQTSLATVTGSISDATGAALANTPVEIRNLENGTVFKGATSSTGNYTLSQLPIGDYELTVKQPGFKTYSHTKFHLAAAQVMLEDVKLEVGNTSDSITVTADASLLKTESSELSHNVTLSQLNNLPILSVGATVSGVRDPFSAAKIVPGINYVNSGAAGSAVTQLVVNGTPVNTTQVKLDGMTMNPTGPRLLGATMETQPSTDAIEEVSMQTSNFAAEYGTAGGALVNMVTKSGTNQYHGSVYDYVVNEDLNAHQPYTGLRNKIRQNDYGFTAGGPLWIPKVYDGRNKTFFFISFEEFRQKNIVTTAPGTVPIDPFRAGDFSSLITTENKLITTASGNATDALGRTIASGTIFDPSSTAIAANGVAYREAFLGNKIPLGSYDTITKKILPLIPEPQGVNFAAGLRVNNYQAPYDGGRVSGIPSIKADQNVGSKGRLSIYYQWTHTSTPRTAIGADAFPDLITFSALSANSGQTGRVNYDYTATPRLLLHFGLGINTSDFALTARVTGYDASKELGLVGATVADNFPQIATGIATNTAIGGMSGLGTSFPSKSFERRPSGNLSAIYVAGSHTYKVGMEYRLEKFPNYVLGNTNGVYTFGTNWTQTPSLQGATINNAGMNGFQFASFLLGGMSSNLLAAPIALSNNKSQTAIYIQDTWKVTRKITFDYGLRWDYGTYTKEQFGRVGSFGAAIPNDSASGRLGAQQFEATCNCNFAKNYPYAVGPRLGLAYQIDKKTVLRAGFGVVYNATNTPTLNASATAQSTNPPAGSGQITGLFKNGMPASVHAVWPSFAPNVNQAIGGVIAFPTFVDPNMGRPARLWQWNVGLQREINRNLVVEVSYVGNRGVWWTANALTTVNALNQNTLTAAGFNDFTSLAESSLLTSTISGLSAAQKSTLAARGITGLPYANFPTATQTVRQSLLQYPQYTVTAGVPPTTGAPLGKTWYDGVQLSVTQRFTHGISFNMNYSDSKNLSLLSSPDVFNRSLGKNLASTDIPQVLRLTAQYQVPNLAKSGIAGLSNKFVAYALSGWGLGVSMQYQSASLVVLPTSTGSVPISNFLGRGPGPAQIVTDASGKQMNPWSVDWTDYSGTHHTDPLDINCHCFDPTKTIVLNPAAFTNVPNGQFGAYQSSIRSFRGPRAPGENANLSRNFRIREGINLNIRAEFNNVFNRTQLLTTLGAPLITSGSPGTKATFFPSGANKGLVSGGYGSMLPLGGLVGQRAGSVVGRITF